MLTNLTEVKDDVLALATACGDHLLEQAGSLSFTNVNAHTKNKNPRWKNPENIESGASGSLLFLLGLYRHTGDDRYLAAADRTIAQLLEYCAAHPTANYSLYTGRGGLIAVLMQRYRLLPGPELITAMLRLAEGANGEYLHSVCTTDYLYDGRGGTLLLLVQLHALTGADFLQGYINEFVQKIVGNARFTADGACWQPRDEMNLRPSCGFARGASGLAYVFGQLNQHNPNEAFDFLLREIRRYTASCWVEDYGNWGDFSRDIQDADTLRAYRKAYAMGDASIFLPGDNLSWAEGAAGILFSSPALAGSRKPAQVEERMAAAAASDSITDNSLYSGLAGMGLYWLQSGNRAALQSAVTTLTGRLSELPVEENLEGGFMHGNTGALYFLLQATGDAHADNILFPFLQGAPDTLEPKAALQLDLSDIRKSMLAARYPRTGYVLAQVGAIPFITYLNAQPCSDVHAELAAFEQFVTVTMAAHFSGMRYECLMDVFSFEKAKNEFRGRSMGPRLRTYLRELEYEDAIISNYLNRPDDWIIRQPLVMSENMQIVYTQWDWSFVDDFEPMRNPGVCERLVRNFSTPPREHEYIFRSDRYQELEEIHCDMVFQLTLHRFNQPKTILEASDEIRQYVHSLPEKALEGLMHSLGAGRSSTTQEFVAQLDTMILDTIKPIVHRNVLAFESFKHTH